MRRSTPVTKRGDRCKDGLSESRAIHLSHAVEMRARFSCYPRHARGVRNHVTSRDGPSESKLQGQAARHSGAVHRQPIHSLRPAAAIPPARLRAHVDCATRRFVGAGVDRAPQDRAGAGLVLGDGLGSRLAVPVERLRVARACKRRGGLPEASHLVLNCSRGCHWTKCSARPGQRPVVL